MASSRSQSSPPDLGKPAAERRAASESEKANQARLSKVPAKTAQIFCRW